MRRRTALRFLGLAVTGGVAGCLSSSPADTQTIDMTADLTFRPDSITVAQGGTVIWENVDPVQHTVTAYESRIPEGAAYFASGGFDSERAARNHVADGLLDEGETFEHTFERTGTYEYFCIPHESSGMVGSIEVA